MKKLNKPCREWSRATFGYTGYGARTFQGRTMGAHRAAWIEAYGPIPKGMCVCHVCDVKLCVEPSHLFLGTQAENIRDAVEKGRIARGRRHAHSKLTDEQVREIRRRRMGGATLQALADEYGVSRSLIWQIAKGVARQIVGRERYTPPPPDRTRQVHAELMRIMYECGYKVGPLALMFGVSPEYVSAKVNRRSMF